MAATIHRTVFGDRNVRGQDADLRALGVNCRSSDSRRFHGWVIALLAVSIGLCTLRNSPVWAQSERSGPAPIQVAAFQADPDDAADDTETETEEEVPLPKLEEMVVPSMRQLLRDKPVDWIVLHPDDVLVAEPVYPRPNTLVEMEKRIEELLSRPPGKTPEEREQRRQERDDLNYLEVTLLDAGHEPEYWLHKKHIKEIIHHEDLMLRRMQLLLDEEKIRETYEMMLALDRRVAVLGTIESWPGTDQIHSRLLYREAEVRAGDGDNESALVFLTDLHGRNPKFEGLDVLSGMVADHLIRRAINDDDYHRARHFVGRLRRLFAEHPTVTHWSEELQQRATQLVSQSTQAAQENQHDVAVDFVEQAVRVWPRLANLEDVHRRVNRRFQRMRVGVVRLPHENTMTFLSAAAERRHDRLTRATLFELDHAEPAVRYASRFFEEWEPVDLGRRVIFVLRQGRSPWESQRVVRSSQIATTLAKHRDPNSPLFNERFAGFVDTITVQSPFQFTVRFHRVPLRAEALLSLPVVEQTALPARENGEQLTNTMPAGLEIIVSSRFYEHQRTADRVVYRRAVPQRDGLVDYRVAEIIETKFASYDKAVQALLRGDVSVLPNVQTKDVEPLREDGRFFVQQYGVPATHVLQFNPESRPLRNRDLRRALAYALDRTWILQETVLQNAGGSFGRVISAPFPQNSYAYNKLVDPRPFDLAVAIPLALNAGRSRDGKTTELKLLCEPDEIVHSAADQLIESWARVGIRVTKISDAAAGQRGGKTPPWDIVYRTVRMVEPLVELWPFLTFDSQAKVDSLAHLPDWLRQELIDLDEAGDWNSAADSLYRLHEHLQREVEVIPLWEVDDFIVIRKTIDGFAERPLFPYQHIERWKVNPWFSTDPP